MRQLILPALPREICTTSFSRSYNVFQVFGVLFIGIIHAVAVNLFFFLHLKMLLLYCCLIIRQTIQCLFWSVERSFHTTSNLITPEARHLSKQIQDEEIESDFMSKTSIQMSIVMRKPVFGVFDQRRLKLACPVIEAM